MIKTTLSKVDNGKEKPFPKLMEATDAPGFIVLFFNERQGTCMVTMVDYKVGERYDRVCTKFKDYKGLITLQNL